MNMNTQFMILQRVCAILIVVALSLVTQAIQAQDNAIGNEFETLFGTGVQEEDFYRTDRELLSATKHLMQVKDAPAIASVVTAEDIRLMGARNLIDVLQRIPGINAGQNFYSLYEIELRGLVNARNSKVKLLIDGHEISGALFGDAAWIYETLSLDNVERVEVIRGPGSALYGSNAFSGIINVVTKTGWETNGTIAYVGGGTFNTRRTSITHGKRYGDLDLLASVTWYTTDGHQSYVPSDIFGFSGNTDDRAKSLDAALKIGWKEVVFNTHYFRRRNGAYIGVGKALSDSLIETDTFYVDLNWSKQLSEQWNVNFKTYVDYMDFTFNWQIMPGASYTTGYMLGTPHWRNDKYGAELGSSYQLTENNKVTAGITWHYDDQHDVTHYANFNPLTFAPLPSYQDVTANYNWNQNASRRILALYFQDEWAIQENLILTVGGRSDDFSDIGSTFNPRLGLVWNRSESMEVKLLYGTAFRAPNFEELFSINNNVAIGNTALVAEEMKTYELGIGYRPFKGLETNLVAYRNKFSNRIELDETLATPQYVNVGDTTVIGVEFEMQYHFSNSELYADLYRQDPVDDSTGDAVADVPGMGADAGIFFWSGDYKGNVHVHHVGERPRTASDSRDDFAAYTTVDISLTLLNLIKDLELRASAYNVMDTEYAYPSTPSALGVVNEDYPAAGRSFMLELSYQIK